ncbi:MAG: polysaccharide deacetylase family protein [Candidatus Kapaibacterium sp.]
MSKTRRNVRRIATHILAVLLLFLFFAFLYSRSWKHALFLEPLYEIKTDRNVVALTFDDGPSDGRTLPLLDLLEKHNVKGTFFMLGQQIEKYPDIARQVVERGHLVGNHSYNHPRMYLKSPGFIRHQIERTDSLIIALGQPDVRYFRPPFSAKFILLPLVLNSMDKYLVTGTYDPPAEYITPYNGAVVAEEIVQNIRPGSIIYLHDGKSSDVEEFLKSVEMTILRLKEMNYEFVRVDEGLRPAGELR